MSNTIASVGSLTNPTGSVFGNIGKTIGTTQGSAYYKQYFDTLNVGWVNPIIPPVTSTPTPTPTPLPIPPDDFTCTILEATGSVRCNNKLELQWGTNANTDVIFNLSWTTPASVSEPVIVFGLNSTSSLINGETDYFKPPTIGLFQGEYTVGVYRPNGTLNEIKIRVETFGAGKISYGRLFGYSSGTSPVILKAFNIQGKYIYHTRNCSGNFSTGTAGMISQVISGSSQQQISASLVGVQSTELVEITKKNGILYLDPIELRYCVTPPPIQPSTESVWVNYDNRGRAQGVWIDSDGNFQSSGIVYGIPYATSSIFDGICVKTGSLALTYGSSYRTQYFCGASDPRTVSYQIDVVTNINGEYNFNYTDPYGVDRNANGIASPNTTIYGIACGYSITTVSNGVPSISSRLC